MSDWWSLVYTAEPGDQGMDPRGIGTYALGQAPDGRGIRTQRYSTDPTINTHTYASISGKAIPYGVGEVWAQAAWEVYWALVVEHGFDPDLKNPLGGSGNQRAMLYVNEGLKNTICSPTFTDVRDGIIQAAAALFNGQDVCLLWEAFAAFGLGEDAVSGGSNSTSPINGFAVPDECLNGLPTVSVAASDSTATEAGPTSGAFTVTRMGDVSAGLTVLYSVGGTAAPDSDYTALSGSVSFVEGQTDATISVDPLDDMTVENDETVVVTLVADPAYNIGAPAEATVTIVSDDQPAGVPVTIDKALWKAAKDSLEVRGSNAPGSATVFIRNADTDETIASVVAGIDGKWTLKIEPFPSNLVTPCAVKAGTGAASGPARSVTNAPATCGGSLPPPTGNITGTVTDSSDGSPIGGASVSADTGENTTTAPDGTYALSNVPTGSRTVTATAGGYVSQNISITVADGETSTVNFALDPETSTGTGTIKGRVTDANTRDRLSGVLVTVDTGESKTTNNSGRYNLGNVPAGSRTVTASKVGYVIQQIMAPLVAGQTVTVDFALVPQ